MIQKPTPTPDLDESDISILDNNQNFNHSIVMNNEGSHEEIDDFERQILNYCPQFPVNTANKKSERSPDEKSPSFIQNFSNLLRKNSKLKDFNQIGLATIKSKSISIAGKSFGSKAVSRKVSPKTSSLRNGNNSYIIKFRTTRV